MQPDKDNDLDWLAFRYVHDELSAADREAFEAQLASDLDACEAVARLVRMADAISAASQPTLRRSVPLKCVAVVFAVAASLLLAVALWQFALREGDTSRLALAWSDVFSGLTAGDENNAPAREEPTPLDFDTSDETPGTTVEPERDGEIAPAWLLAAVEYQHEAAESRSRQPAIDALMPEPVLENY